MKKLTDFQIENLIESVIQNDKKIKAKKIVEHYTNRWNKCVTKKEKYEFFNEFFSNRKKLINEGYDVNLLDESILGSLFSGGLGGFKSAFKEWFAGKLVGFLGVDDPDLKKALSIGIANLDWTSDWSKLFSPIKNCEFFATQIAHSVIEYYVAKKADTWFGGGAFATALRNAVVDGLNSEQHIKTIEDSIAGIICNAIRKMFGGSGSVIDKVKNVMTGKKEPQTPPTGTQLATT